MKGLNKLALATAVAAAPFAAQAELTAMSDQAMGNTTGQSGVTIELETNIGIGQIEYTQETGSGSVLVNNLSLGGIDEANSGNPAPAFGESLDLKVNVDLPTGDADQSTLADFDSKSGQDSALQIDGGTGDVIKADPSSSTGYVDPTSGDEVTPSDPANVTAIGSLGGTLDQDLSDGDALISVQSLEDGTPVDMNVNLGGTEGNAFQLANADGTNTATLMSSFDADLFLTQLDMVARNDNVVGTDDSIGSLEIEAGFAIDNLDAEFDVASVGIEGMRMAGAGSLDTTLKDASNKGTGQVLGAGAAIVSMDIGQGQALSDDGSGNVAGGETLRINLDNFQADIWMPTINVGNGANASIGSVGISNLQVSNTKMAIYGRE